MLVSVVVPCFNAARWLPRALDSLVAQDHRELEVVAVDDGSTDATAAVLAAHAARDARIRVVTLPRNAGIVAALNRGLDEARGEFVARLDADDVAMPGRLRAQLEYLHAHGLDACGSWFVEFGQGLARTTCWPHAEGAVKAGLMFQNMICHPTLLARRGVFGRFRYREEYRLSEDYDLFARASAEFRLGNVPQALIRYRRHPGQATQARREAMEAVARRIRIETLVSRGHAPSADEQVLHNQVRAPASIASLEALHGIERWLTKLRDAHDGADARQVIASQWLRACIRAAPLGLAMWRAWRGSPLRAEAGAGARADADLLALALLRLDYAGAAFFWLRRLGLSA